MKMQEQIAKTEKNHLSYSQLALIADLFAANLYAKN